MQGLLLENEGIIDLIEVEIMIKRTISYFSEVKKQVALAFSLVAGLSWTDAIKSFIGAFIPQQNAWPFLILNASIITFFAAVVIRSLKEPEK